MRALTTSMETEHGDAAIFLAAWQAVTYQSKGYGYVDQWCLDNSEPIDVMNMIVAAVQSCRQVPVQGPAIGLYARAAEFICAAAYTTLTLTALLDMLDIKTVDDKNHKQTFSRNGVLVGRYDSNEGWALLRALENPMTPTEFDTRFAALPKED